MPTITYDPVLETTEPPRSPAPPHPGTALVVELAGTGPLVILYGERVGVRHYRRAHLVDLAPHDLALAARLPSREPGAVFDATVRFRCQVSHPVMVAVHEVHDLTALVRPRLVKILRAATRHLDGHDVAVAEAALRSTLDRFRGNSAARLGGFVVELEAGGAHPTGTTGHQAPRLSHAPRPRLRPALVRPLP